MGIRLLTHHILMAIKTATLERKGQFDLSEKLSAQAKLRLIIMTDDELRKLAKMLALGPESSEVTLERLLNARKKALQHRQWTRHIGVVEDQAYHEI